MTDIYPLPPPFSDDEVLQPLQPRTAESPRRYPALGRARAVRTACVAAAVLAAAGIGALVLVGDGPISPDAGTTALEAGPAPAAPGERTDSTDARAAAVGPPAAAKPAEPTPPAPLPAAATAAPPVAVPPPPPQPPSPPAPAPRAEPVRRLASEEIRTYLERAEALLTQGDLAAARLFFERLSEAGDARGASGLARSHDPAVLSRLPIHGIAGDPAEAERWRRVAAAMAPAFAERR